MKATHWIGLGVLLASLCYLTGCGPSLETRISRWPSGEERVRESYYVTESGQKVRHGPTIFLNTTGTVIAEGEWRDDKPWSGVCWIPAFGDAGSWGGVGRFERFEEGRSLGQVPVVELR